MAESQQKQHTASVVSPSTAELMEEIRQLKILHESSAAAYQKEIESLKIEISEVKEKLSIIEGQVQRPE